MKRVVVGIPILLTFLLLPSFDNQAIGQVADPSGCRLKQTHCKGAGAATSIGNGYEARAAWDQRVSSAVRNDDPQAASGPDREWAYVPACPNNGPPGGWGDALCPGATETCGQADQILFREYLSIGGGPWTSTGTVCLGPVDFQQANGPTPPWLVALDAWKRMRMPVPRLSMKPGVAGLANLESYFWISGPFTQSITATAGPNQVTVDAVAASYEWRFGDGSAPMVTGVPGRPWPARSEIAHAYRRLGRFEVQVTVRWQGRFRVNGGPAQVVPGPPVARSSTVTYPVRELQTVLTR
jgi:hypothetical protein